MKYVSGQASLPSGEPGPRIFEDIDAMMRWCQRYYSNGTFLFRAKSATGV
jgi:hypothetical protein